MDDLPKLTVRTSPNSSTVPHLLFRVGRSIYAVPVSHVGEVVLLPQLQPVAEQLPFIVGMLNLRGKIVPVMDLELRLGSPASSHSADDKLLVLQNEDQVIAILIHEAMEVQRIDAGEVQHLSHTSPAAQSLLRGVVRLENALAQVLDAERILSSLDAAPWPLDVERGESRPLLMDAVPSDLEKELRTRAERLGAALTNKDQANTRPVAVAEIGDELYAFEFEFVQKFFTAVQVTPVPCCPPHVIGNVNLEGQILTVIDIRGQLNLPVAPKGTAGKIIVVKTAELVVGVLVDDLRDVVYLRPQDISSTGLSAALSGHVKGTAHYEDRLMSILDLRRLMALEHWVVDEEVGRG